jgi:hypothetical protein
MNVHPALRGEGMGGDGGVDRSRRAFLKLASIASAALALSATSIVDAQSPVPYKAWKARWSLGEIGVRRML